MLLNKLKTYIFIYLGTYLTEDINTSGFDVIKGGVNAYGFSPVYSLVKEYIKDMELPIVPHGIVHCLDNDDLVYATNYIGGALHDHEIIVVNKECLFLI